jgi:hypothetical protein
MVDKIKKLSENCKSENYNVDTKIVAEFVENEVIQEILIEL